MSKEFEYLYGKKAEQFAYVNIPKALIHEEAFSDVSLEAKAIYGMMIVRVTLSIKKRWRDEDGKTYIHYSVADIMADTGCGKNKILKCLKELEESTEKASEVCNVNTNNTENNNTNINYINPILSIYTEDEIDGMDEFQTYSEKGCAGDI